MTKLDKRAGARADLGPSCDYYRELLSPATRARLEDRPLASEVRAELARPVPPLPGEAPCDDARHTATGRGDERKAQARSQGAAGAQARLYIEPRVEPTDVPGVAKHGPYFYRKEPDGGLRLLTTGEQEEFERELTCQRNGR